MNAPVNEIEPSARAYAMLVAIPLLIVTVLVVRIIIDHPKAASSSVEQITLSMTFAGPCASDASSSLAVEPMAFEATVASIDSASATLNVSRVFTGTPSPRVTVTLPTSPPAPSLQMPTFVAGKTYLVAVDEAGSVVGCGLSGVETSALQNLYTQAVGGA